MDEKKRMYDLLVEGSQAEDLTLTIPQSSPDAPVITQMLALGLLKLLSGDYEDTLVEVTGNGLSTLNQARARDRSFVELTHEPQPITFTQTVHGTAHTQVGNHNTMTVHGQQGIGISELLQVVLALRESAKDLPEDEREETAQRLQRAEQAVREGNFDKARRYATTLMDIGGKSVEFGTKAYEFAKLLGVV